MYISGERVALLNWLSRVCKATQLSQTKLGRQNIA